MRDPRVKAALKQLGANVRRLRLKGGETQEALALRAGLEPRSLQRVEAGMTGSIATIVRIADALRVPVAGLFRKSRRLARRPVGRPRRELF